MLNLIVLNIRTRTDRLEHILKECSKINIEPIIIDAIVPSDIVDIPYHIFETELAIKNRFTKGMYACNQSTIKIFEYAISNRLDSFILLEDDTIFIDNIQQHFSEVLNKLENIDYDVIQLSSYHYSRPEYFRNDFYKVRGSWIANMNIYNHTSYSKCLDLLKHMRPFDLSLGMVEYLKHGLKIYAYYTNLAYSGDFESDIDISPDRFPLNITEHIEIIPYEILQSRS